MTTSTPSRRALLLTTDDGPVDEIVDELAAAGYEVRRCHEGGLRFPCAGLAGGGCPLEATGGVDVAIDVRQHPWPDPTSLEVGVTCALRAGVPLVVVGRRGHPFEPWAMSSVEGGGDLAARCEQAMRDALGPAREAVSGAVRSVLDNHGLGDEPVAVDVTRQRNRLHVSIGIEADDTVRGLAAARAASALRPLDRAATAIEIDVAAPQR